MTERRSSEELRRILASASDELAPKATPLKPKESSTKDLARLINAVDNGESPSTVASRMLSKELRGMKGDPRASMRASENSFQASQQSFNTAPLSADHSEEFTVFRYGIEFSLRGKLGRYATAVLTHVESESSSNPATTSAINPRNTVRTSASGSVNGGAPATSTSVKPATNANQVYRLGVDGQGVGEPLDSLMMVNLDNKECAGPVKYGSTVALRAPAAKERLLGVREGGKLGFWRNLVGQGEKWTVLKANAVGRTVEEPNSRGSVVHTGDLILLQSGPLPTPETTRAGNVLSAGELLLCLYEGPTGTLPRLQYRDRCGLGEEAWQIELFGSQPLPAWHSRPYLSGRFIATPSEKRNSKTAEAHAFPNSTSAINADSIINGVPKTATVEESPVSLSTLPIAVQEAVLVREVLLALTGVEGEYIRVAADNDCSPQTDGGIEMAQDMFGMSLNASMTSGASLRAASPLRKGYDAGSLGGFTASLPTHLRPSDPSTGLDQAHARSGKLGNSSGSKGVNHKRVQLTLDEDSVDRSTASQVSLLLPLCENSIEIRDFVKRHARYDYGLVSHALAAGVKALLREFDVLIAQLESLALQERLSLQKLLYMLQPARSAMRLLAQLCNRVDHLAGGRLLDELHTALRQQGDAKAKELYGNLLNKASQPFLQMLEQWLFKGELNDPYREFMIAEHAHVSREALSEDFNARYWEGHFTLRDTHVPKVCRQHALKALTAGKYLTVVRDCVNFDTSTSASAGSQYGGRAGNGGGKDKTPHSTSYRDNADIQAALAMSQRLAMGSMQELRIDTDGSTAIPRAIESAYAYSSRALLRLLEERYLLSGQLRSLRRFFLLEHGDFFTQFMDVAEDELKREVRDVGLVRIQGLLQLAIQTSTLAADPFREEFTCSLESHNLIQHLHLIQCAGDGTDTTLYRSTQGLKGVEALTLDYKSEWPVSIILSRRAITKYQLLSRLLFFSKYVEMRVLNSWKQHMFARGLDVRGVMGPFYCLRHRMIHFLQNFVYYMTLEVISPRAHELETAFTQAQDMDEVLDSHEKFLDHCLKECLLASQELLNTLTKIMATCLVFADYVKVFSESCLNAKVNGKNVGTNGKNTSASAGVAGATDTVRRKASDSQLLSRNKSFRDGGDDAEFQKKVDRCKQRMAKRQETLSARKNYILAESKHDSFMRNLVTFESKFDKEVGDFLERLWTDSYRSHPQLINLCVRLDYNGYYSARFASDISSGMSAALAASLAANRAKPGAGAQATAPSGGPPRGATRPQSEYESGLDGDDDFEMY